MSAHPSRPVIASASGPGHLVEEARLGQHPANRLGLTVQDLGHQVFTDAPLVGRQFRDKPGRMPGALHPHRRQPQPRDPSLGPGQERVQVLRRQGYAVCREQCPHLPAGHGQLRRAQFVHQACQPVAVHRQQRVTAGGEHQTQRRRLAADDLIQPVEHGRVRQHMRILDHQDRRSRKAGQAAQQRLHHADRRIRRHGRREFVQPRARQQRRTQQQPEPPGRRIGGGEVDPPDGKILGQGPVR
jgi:hypothetical protein